MYVAVKGGERAIENAHRLLAQSGAATARRRKSRSAQISEQLGLGVERVMSEGSLYDEELAALAIKQARGDLVEAIFLVRAYRTTLPRFGLPSRSTPRPCRSTAHFGNVQGHSGRTDARCERTITRSVCLIHFACRRWLRACSAGATRQGRRRADAARAHECSTRKV